MKISDLFSESLLNKMLDSNYVYCQKHPIYDIYLYNYTKSCVFDHVWNECTTKCRGLIVDNNKNVIALPFEKFFNYEEIVDKSTIPSLPFDAYEKVDGSLGIVYWVDGKPHICTHGSFESEQAKHAEKILYKKYKDNIEHMNPQWTYMFEIVYPENHLVVNYGDTDDIILLAVKDYGTGKEYDIDGLSDTWHTAKHYSGVTDWKTIRDQFSGDNREGFVIRFENGFRMKMKYEEYFKMHFVMSSISEKRVLEYIIDERLPELDEILSFLDEENQIYVKDIAKKFNGQYDAIYDICKSEMKEFPTLTKINADGLETKELSIEGVNYYRTCTYPAVMMAMAKDKEYKHIIWKIVKKNLKIKE